MESNPGWWGELFQGQVDLYVIVAIAVITFFVQSLVSEETHKRFYDALGVAMPGAFGALWGLTLALEVQWGFGTHVLKGLLINGGAALFLARIGKVCIPVALKTASDWLPTLIGGKIAK